MKSLTLLRHAKSSWDDPVQRDFDRPLNRKGHRAAKAMGGEMRRLGLRFDAVIASPALRVKETLASVAEGYGAPLETDFDANIYLAPAETLLQIIQAAPDDVERLMLVGHSHGLDDLVFLLVPDRPEDAERDKVEEKYPTASLAEITLDIDHWADAAPARGHLLRFIRPRDLDPALGPDPEAI